ncbi:MAG: cytochrome bd-I oxidase subunit CydX [Stappiaceae bacterium]
MWYFAWILGLPLACCLAILNAMWLEMREDDDKLRQTPWVPEDNK